MTMLKRVDHVHIARRNFLQQTANAPVDCLAPLGRNSSRSFVTQTNPLDLVATQGHPLRHFMAVSLEAFGDANTSSRVMTREESTPRLGGLT
jgi:hypothetical protein